MTNKQKVQKIDRIGHQHGRGKGEFRWELPFVFGDGNFKGLTESKPKKK